MGNFRRRDFENFLRRKIEKLEGIEWDPGRGHTTITVTTADGRRASASVPGTATDQPRRRENIAATLRRKLRGEHP